MGSLKAMVARQTTVIPALVAGIHLSACSGFVDGWIPGTRPGMTLRKNVGVF